MNLKQRDVAKQIIHFGLDRFPFTSCSLAFWTVLKSLKKLCNAEIWWVLRASQYEKIVHRETTAKPKRWTCLKNFVH